MKYTLVVTALLLGAATAQADAAKGKEIFDQRCTTCHGALGAGDGPVAAALPADQKPRNLQQAQFKYATDDAKLKEIIHKGGAAFGLNPLMPPQADLSDADLSSVVEYVHSLKK